MKSNNKILTWIGAVVILASSAAIGCDGGGGGTGGSGGSGASGGSGGSGATGGGGSGGSSGSECGGIAGLTCADDEYCDYKEDNCGADDSLGECKPKPETCPDIYSPVCTCAGTVASNDCDAAGSGQDISIAGGCSAPDGMFACGAGFCELATQYCQHTTSDIGGEPDSFSCAPLPAACDPGPVSCDCLANESCGNMCAETDGGFTLTCPGG